MELNTRTKSVRSTIKSKDVHAMTIDNESIEYIIDSLTKIYPNEILAVVREYPSNARDSHVEAGQVRPIEVTLPSLFNHNFVVQDWGVGMGRYELEKVYGVYGKSTKRKSNSLVGAYGLGSKSALTLVDSFSLVSIKDGWKYNVLISKNENGVGELNILSEVETDEPNGVTVTIPARQNSDFAHYAKQMFLTWEPGTVLVNGKQPVHIGDVDYDKVGNFGYVKRRKGTYGNESGLSVVMGGISYRLANLSYTQMSELFQGLPNQFRYQDIVLLAEIGDVELVPSREDVRTTPKTLRFVAKQLKALVGYMQENAKKEVSAAKTEMEVLELLDRYSFLYGRSEFTWKNKPVPSFVETLTKHWKFHGNGRKYDHGANANITLTTDSKGLIVDTSNTTLENSTIMRHIKVYAEAQGITLGNLFLGPFPHKVKPKETNNWLKALIDAGNFTVVTAEEVAEISKAHTRANRKKRIASGAPRETITYPAYTLGENGKLEWTSLTPTEISETDKDVFYIKLRTDAWGTYANDAFEYGEGSALAKEIMTDYIPEGMLVVISGTRQVDSFEKRLKGVTAKNIVPVFEEKITERAQVKPDVADELAEKFAGQGGNTYNLIKELAGKKLESPLLVDVFKRVAEGTHRGSDKLEDAAHKFLSWPATKVRRMRLGLAEDESLPVSALDSFYAQNPLFHAVVNGLSYRVSITDTLVNEVSDYLNASYRAKGDFKG